MVTEGESRSFSQDNYLAFGTYIAAVSCNIWFDYGNCSDNNDCTNTEGLSSESFRIRELSWTPVRGGLNSAWSCHECRGLDLMTSRGSFQFYDFMIPFKTGSTIKYFFYVRDELPVLNELLYWPSVQVAYHQAKQDRYISVLKAQSLKHGRLVYIQMSNKSFWKNNLFQTCMWACIARSYECILCQ